MDNTAEFVCLNFQSGVFPTAYLCSPRFADAKPLDSAEKLRIGGRKTDQTPKSLNGGFNKYEETRLKNKQLGKSLRIMMSHQSSAAQKTILFSKTPVSVSNTRLCCGRRSP
jgi:hypothetical protein